MSQSWDVAPEAAPHPDSGSMPEPQPRRRAPVLAIVLASLLVVVLGVLAYFVVMLIETQQRLSDAELRIEQLDRRVEEQQEAVDAKDTFAQSAQAFMDVARAFDGLPFATIVPLETVERQAQDAWRLRWEPQLVAELAGRVDEERARLEALAAAAAERLASGSDHAGAAMIDSLGAGYVRSAFEDADALCGGDVLACVQSEDPYLVHFDVASDNQPAMTDWIRTGLAYHEFAHVLQFTNPGPTESAAAAFGGDWETMADCYALTTLPGWTLDHEVPINAFSWWQISVGYGVTCDETQRQVIRDWLGQIGFHLRPIQQ